MEKLDKVIAGLWYCCEPNNICEDGCPYHGQREGDKRCLDFLMEDALEWLKEQNRLIRELSDNIPCCDNCEGKTVLGERTDKCVYEIEGLDSVIYCASRGIQNCFGYQKKIDALTEENLDLRKDIEVLSEDNARLKKSLKVARLQRKQAWEKLARITGEREAAWLSENGESVSEFPREGM